MKINRNDARRSTADGIKNYIRVVIWGNWPVRIQSVYDKHIIINLNVHWQSKIIRLFVQYRWFVRSVKTVLRLLSQTKWIAYGLENYERFSCVIKSQSAHVHIFLRKSMNFLIEFITFNMEFPPQKVAHNVHKNKFALFLWKSTLLSFRCKRHILRTYIFIETKRIHC